LYITTRSFLKNQHKRYRISTFGLSILEISHRSKDFVAVMDEARSLALELLGLEGKDTKPYFGGASLEFLMVPYNLMKEGGKAAYLDTGTWASGKLLKKPSF
jgi:phosphoserine aminotransferase